MKMHCRHTDDEVHTSGHERTQAGTTSYNSRYTFYSKALHSSLLDGPTVCCCAHTHSFQVLDHLQMPMRGSHVQGPLTTLILQMQPAVEHLKATSTTTC